MIDVHTTPLFSHLGALDQELYGKALELRRLVSGWLSYVPATFPHYTRHTVEHSDEIIRQMSSLLFTEDGTGQPITEISAMEAYVLIAAAFLHDAGMVCSDSEKAEILSSPDWKEWVSDGIGAERWSEISALRKAEGELEEPVKNFLADLETRFLISEFVRKRHHIRSGQFLIESQEIVSKFAFDDPILAKTIADVCIGHGLNRADLDDPSRFPFRRDIRNYKTNVRFIATILRLGDLLDVSSDRACPLLLDAACPLPESSFAHWSQYGRITHRVTCPDVIEIVAECDTQEEHRLLKDWCQWIVDEVKYAAVTLRHTPLHTDWVPPLATMDGTSPSIAIGPSDRATYIPYDWRLELDPVAVTQHLVNNVYDDDHAFVRELIQNALDATRCRICLESNHPTDELVDFPQNVSREVLAQFPIVIEFSDREIIDQMSGLTERKQLLSVEDSGIGMTVDVIQRYLLQ
ncbi:MAG: hypothetical protein QNJ73_08980, partial [Gammaproteobacteria bacterium]|nr:hypothetical protein [Gammaproteobacteria bacterium]